jgi:hypothetical protein
MQLRKEIHKLYAEVGKHPEKYECIKTDELLNAYNKDTNSYLDNKTSKEIEESVEKSLDLLTCIKGNAVPRLGASASGTKGSNCWERSSLKKNKKELLQTLVGYRYVDQLDELHMGKFTRWIQKYPLDPETNTAKVERGGFLSNIDFNDNGVTLTIRMWNKKVYKLAFDNCLIYQKLSVGEELILMTSDYIGGE